MSRQEKTCLMSWGLSFLNKMANIIQAVKDSYNFIRNYFIKEDEESLFFNSSRDPCDISPEKLEAMRRKFDRVAGKYSLENIAV